MKIQNELLIHTVKTIQFRFLKALNISKEDFGQFKIRETTRCPNEIINHMCDLAIKTKTKIIEGHFIVNNLQLLNFINEKKRFINELKELQSVIALFEIEIDLSKKLLQGPLSDMVTHIGQIALLNGLYGNKVPKENYFDEDMDIGF